MSKMRVILELDDVVEGSTGNWSCNYKNVHEAMYALFGDDAIRSRGASVILRDSTTSMTIETVPMPKGFTTTNRGSLTEGNVSDDNE